MMSTTITPARSSNRPYPYVKRRLVPSLLRAKAVHSGIAVAASPKLWMVSERRAIEPESTTTTICTRAVAKSPTKDHFTAQMPRSEVAMEASTAPCAWPCSPLCPCWWSCAMLLRFYQVIAVWPETPFTLWPTGCPSHVGRAERGIREKEPRPGELERGMPPQKGPPFCESYPYAERRYVLRSLRGLARTQNLKVFYSDHFVLPLPEGHRFPMVKYSMLRRRVAASGICGPEEIRVPRAVSDQEILRSHERGYLRQVVAGTLKIGRAHV